MKALTRARKNRMPARKVLTRARKMCLQTRNDRPSQQEALRYHSNSRHSSLSIAATVPGENAHERGSVGNGYDAAPIPSFDPSEFAPRSQADLRIQQLMSRIAGRFVMLLYYRDRSPMLTL